ncbi:MAG: ECF-type sigma factor [Pirellulales bacterium]
MQNPYEGLLDAGQVALILRRAKRYGWRGQDLDDAVQMVAIALLKFRFDPARSNGASEETAVTKVIDHCLTALRRRENRHQARKDRLRQIALPETIDSGDAQVDAALDVQQVLGDLSSRSQQICDCLRRGLSIRETCQSLGLSWRAVQHELNIIRHRLTACGLASAEGQVEVAA